MRPVPIPKSFDLVVERIEGASKHVIAPPGGNMLDPDVAPVEALFVPGEGIMLRVALEDGDLDKLRERPFVWLTLSTRQLPVFSIATECDRFVDEVLRGGESMTTEEQSGSNAAEAAEGAAAGATEAASEANADAAQAAAEGAAEGASSEGGEDAAAE